VSSLDTDLAAYYDQEAAQRATRALDPRRVEQREEFADLLGSDGRRRLLEIGTGPGRDGTAFMARGLAVSGVDLSPEHVRLARAAGLDAYVASVLNLPFADDSFEAGWTMSTLLHVPDKDFDAALREVRRVLTRGAPLAVGVWGGRDAEGPKEDDEIQPPRFFSLRSHERLLEMLGRHGTVERFETWPAVARAGQAALETTVPWTYQWALVRTS
jgi:SAM-dependent methyltransferase